MTLPVSLVQVPLRIASNAVRPSTSIWADAWLLALELLQMMELVLSVSNVVLLANTPSTMQPV